MGSPGFQEGGEGEVESGLLQGLGEVEEVVEVAEGQGSQRCCLEEEEGTLETAAVGLPQAAILVWS